MHQKNNFDFLRLTFASLVIVTHSYIFTGLKEHDWLWQVTNGQVVFSYIGVIGFFIISGFLIFQSLERSKTLLDYFWKRFLRLFPALFVVLTLTILLGIFVYENSTIPYLQNISVWTYVPRNLSLYKLQENINGVFENNPHPSTINGSLWTIPYEFTMYVLLSFLFFFRKNIFFTRFLLVSAFVLLAIGNIFFKKELGHYTLALNSGLLLDVGIFFIGGSVLASIKIEKNKHFGLLALISFLLLVISLITGYFYIVSYFALPVMVIFLGLKSTPVINNIGNKIGDLSYGIYIYGAPVQQTLVHYFKLNYLQLMFLSLIISASLAWMSWHLVEAKALKLKRMHWDKLSRQGYKKIILHPHPPPPSHF